MIAISVVGPALTGYPDHLIHLRYSVSSRARNVGVRNIHRIVGLLVALRINVLVQSYRPIGSQNVPNIVLCIFLLFDNWKTISISSNIRFLKRKPCSTKFLFQHLFHCSFVFVTADWPNVAIVRPVGIGTLARISLQDRYWSYCRKSDCALDESNSSYHLQMYGTHLDPVAPV